MPVNGEKIFLQQLSSFCLIACWVAQCRVGMCFEVFPFWHWFCNLLITKANGETANKSAAHLAASSWSFWYHTAVKRSLQRPSAAHVDAVMSLNQSNHQESAADFVQLWWLAFLCIAALLHLKTHELDVWFPWSSCLIECIFSSSSLHFKLLNILGSRGEHTFGHSSACTK